MADLSTRATGASVDAFLAGIGDEERRRDALAVLDIMRRATGCEPAMWGADIVGFGTYHYRYASGREGDWFLTGLSPRKRNLTLYVLPDLDRFAALLGRLGRHTTGRACLYLRRLDDVDPAVLEELVSASVRLMRETYGSA